jgi:hypothetical protein
VVTTRAFSRRRWAGPFQRPPIAIHTPRGCEDSVHLPHLVLDRLKTVLVDLANYRLARISLAALPGTLVGLRHQRPPLLTTDRDRLHFIVNTLRCIC